MDRGCAISVGRKPLPVAVDSFAEICDRDYYYVDKTLLIKRLVDYGAKAVLFTRPRRFGKSLNMDMLRTFFEIPTQDTARYFRNKKIWECGPKYTDLQGHYPVIHLSFRGMSGSTFDDMLFDFGKVIQNEFRRQCSTLDMENLNGSLQEQFEGLAYGKPTHNELRWSLQDLTLILHQAHGVAPIILIDEYDAPIENAWTEGYYDEAVKFMRGLLSPALKSNPDLSFACLTGVLRVAREGIFSGLNNLKVDGVLSKRYDEFFGFTPEEIQEMARAYDAEDKYQEIRDWYEGYRFGNQEVFNPWSVVNYFDDGCEPKAYWANTASDAAIGNILDRTGPEVKEDFVSLLNGRTVWSRIDDGLKYPDIDTAPGGNTAEAVCTLLLMSGYLTPTGRVSKNDAEEREFLNDDAEEIDLKIPNHEVRRVFRNVVLERFLKRNGQNLAAMLGAALKAANAQKTQEAMKEILLRGSFHDLTAEQYYHVLLLGISVGISGFTVFSNRESGSGRYDICMEPKVHHQPGILIEVKWKEDLDEDALKKLAEEALDQIWEKEYEADLRARGVPKVHAFGMAFSGKNVQVVEETRSLK